MPCYIQFTAADGSTMLLEVEGEETATQEGVVKAGLMDKAQEVIIRRRTWQPTAWQATCE